jgi:toxin ParE1/3/4
MRIEWTTLADADLKNIFAHIRNDSPAASVDVIATIRRAVRNQLAMSPFLGRAGRVRGTRELVVPRLPYIVAYRVTDSSIQILRVLHGAQRWPKIF